MRSYFVYVLASRSRVLYVGVTNDLMRRIYEHKTEALDGFTKRYGVRELVYFEATVNVGAAIAREKQLKRWTRTRKFKLIEANNPDWRDLSIDWYDNATLPFE